MTNPIVACHNLLAFIDNYSVEMRYKKSGKDPVAEDAMLWEIEDVCACEFAIGILQHDGKHVQLNVTPTRCGGDEILEVENADEAKKKGLIIGEFQIGVFAVQTGGKKAKFLDLAAKGEE